jgi:hypothetical protein
VNAAAIAIGLVTGVILIVGIGWLLTGNPLAGTPNRIVRHIRQTGTVYEFRMRPLAEVWNPQKQLAPSQGVSGPGTPIRQLEGTINGLLVRIWDTGD